MRWHNLKDISKSTIINECQKEPEESYLFKYQYILHITCENNWVISYRKRAALGKWYANEIVTAVTSLSLTAHLHQPEDAMHINTPLLNQM